MRPFRIATAILLISSLTAPAFAGDIAASVTAAAEAAAQAAPLPKSSSHKIATIGGAALFVSGMAVGLNAFINNQNGDYSEFGEANAVNKPLGAAGISMAFAGGLLMFVGSHASKAPSLSVQKGGFKLGKSVTW